MPKPPTEPPVGDTEYGVPIRPFKRIRHLHERPAAPFRPKCAPKETLSVAELLDIVSARALPPAEAPLAALKGSNFHSLIKEWVRVFGFRPGAKAAAQSGDLYRHFLMWLDGDLPVPPPADLNFTDEFGGVAPRSRHMLNKWTQALRRMGFAMGGGRLGSQMQVCRAVLMDALSARYAKAWVLANEVPPGESEWAMPKHRRTPGTPRPPKPTKTEAEPTGELIDWADLVAQARGDGSGT